MGISNLNEMQRRFAEEYIKDFNATQAALRAGYSEKTAYSQGQRLLKHVEIKAHLAKFAQKAADRYEVTAERVTRELALLGFSNVKDLAGKSIDEIDRDAAASIKEMTTEAVQSKDGSVVLRTKYKTADKHSALKTLAQITGLLAQEGPPPQSVVFIVERSGGRQRVIEHDPGD